MGPFHVAIVAILAGCLLKAWSMRYPKQESDKLESQIAEQQQQIESLIERVQTLEKIVTDENYSLKQQINQL